MFKCYLSKALARIKILHFGRARGFAGLPSLYYARVIHNFITFRSFGFTWNISGRRSKGAQSVFNQPQKISNLIFLILKLG